MALGSLFSFVSRRLRLFASFSSSLKTQNEHRKVIFKFAGVSTETGIIGEQSGLERGPIRTFFTFCFKGESSFTFCITGFSGSNGWFLHAIHIGYFVHQVPVKCSKRMLLLWATSNTLHRLALVFSWAPGPTHSCLLWRKNAGELHPHQETSPSHLLPLPSKLLSSESLS